jgi:hypothetical protein
MRSSSFDRGRFSRRNLYVDPGIPSEQRNRATKRLVGRKNMVGRGVQRGRGDYGRRRVRMVGSDMGRRA